jgi:ATP-binding cassette, subfamily B, bacterial
MSLISQYIPANIRPFLQYFKGQKKQLISILILVIISTILQVANPWAVSSIIDNFIAKNNVRGMDMYLVIFVFTIILLAGVSYTSTTMVGNLAQLIVFQLRQDVFNKIQQMPAQFFIVNNSGEIISRINNDTRKIDTFLSRYIFEFISSFFIFVGIGLFIFTQNWIMALVAWAMVIVLIIFSQLVGPAVKQASKDQLQNNGQLTTFLNENIGNYKAIVAFGQQETILNSYKDLVDQSYHLSFKARLLAGIFRPIYNFAGLISQTMVIAVGLYLVSQGQASTGILISFIFYINRFYEPINRLAAVYASYQQAVGAWSRIQEVLSMSPQASNLIINQSADHLELDIDS